MGDAKITHGQGQGRMRGMVAEVEYLEGEDEEEGGVIDWDWRERILRSFWDSVVDGSGVGMEGMRVVVKVPGGQGEGEMGLVRQYMELLIFARA